MNRTPPPATIQQLAVKHRDKNPRENTDANLT